MKTKIKVVVPVSGGNAFHHGGDFGRSQFSKVIWLGQKIGKSIWTSKGGKSRNEGAACAVCQFS